MPSKKEEKKWGGKRKKQQEQILLRPGMYMGSVYLEKRTDYVLISGNNSNDNKGKKIKIAKENDEEKDTKISGEMYIPSDEEYDYKNNLIIDPESIKIEEKEIYGCPGLENMISEGIVNVQDNVIRSIEAEEKTTRVEVDITSDGKIRIWNNGLTIPVEIFEDEEEDLYAPEAAFGRFNVSENYDDDEDRATLGQNGFGATLIILMSTDATVRTFDKNSYQYYEQTWRDNLNLNLPRERLVTGDKKIINKKCTPLERKGFTEVTFLPDFKRFNHDKKLNPGGMKNFTADIINVFKRKVIDMAMITKVPTYFNGVLIKVKSLADYSKFFIEDNILDTIGDEDDEDAMKFSDTIDTFLEIKTKTSHVILRPSSKYKFMAFTNGGHNHKGGVHVTTWTETLLRPIIDKINNKGTKKAVRKTKATPKAKAKTKAKEKEKKFKITIKDIKKHFMIFIVCNVVNPKFNDQMKSELIFPPIDTEVKVKDINKVMKWDFVTRIDNYIKLKELMDMKKILGTGKKKILPVVGLNKANLAGKSQETILIICEGKSAKETVDAGISTGLFGVKGRDYIAVMAILGKLLNCRKATANALKKNKVVIGIVRALGIEIGVDYSKKANRKKLPYNKLGIMTDADVDGIHIRALIVNLIDFFAPSLTEAGDFVYNINTPIIGITSIKNPLYFYNQENARKYITENNIPKKSIKYYKGLGTWTNKSIPAIFGANITSYKKDTETNNNLDGAFSGKTLQRKLWINSYDPKDNSQKEYEDGTEYLTMDAVKPMNISNLIRKQVILYFVDSCIRMLPNVFDGNKESTRKILYTFFKLGLNFNKKTQKVEIIAGKVSETSSYHHGDGNLESTIARMAQGWPGTNNVNLLYPDGQFGGQGGGRDSMAAGRYIFTKLEALTKLIFRQEDEAILGKQEDDGEEIEPKYYLPIVCMYIINTGKSNIATGYSSSIPSYDLLDVIDYQKSWLKNKYYQISNKILLLELPELHPKYRGFKGTIEKCKNGYLASGIMEKLKNNVYQITEIPPDKCIDNIRVKLDRLIELKEIKNYKDNCDEDPKLPIDITFTCVDENKFGKGKGVSLKSLGLETVIHTTNMVGIIDDNKVVKFSNIDDIMEIYLNKRYEGYCKRKKYQLESIETDIKWLSNKIRYIKSLGKEIIIDSEDELKVIKLLDKLGFDRKVDKRQKKIDDDEEEEKEPVKTGTFNYLLNMPNRIQTTTRLKKLEKELENLKEELKTLENKTEAEIWIEEMDELANKYKKWIDEKDTTTTKKKKKKKK